MPRDLLAPDVFVSYSWNDSQSVVPFVNALIEQLKGKNIIVYFDRYYCPLDDPASLEVGLSSGLSSARVFMACISHYYLQSKWCAKEMSAFCLRYLSEKGIAESNLTSKQDLNLATSPVFCLPVAVDCDDPYELTRRLGMMEMAYIKYQIGFNNKLKDYAIAQEQNIIRDFICSGNKAFYRANLDYPALARAVGSYVENLLGSCSATKRILNPKLVWMTLWRIYELSEIGESIDPLILLADFTPSLDTIMKTQALADRYADEGITNLFASVVSGKNNSVSFDRWNNINLLPQKDDSLKLSSMCGDPLALLVNQIRNHPILQILQYSYYAYVSKHGQNKLIDVCAVAIIAMNIHSWYERIHDVETIQEVILKPLAQGTDIASLYCY